MDVFASWLVMLENIENGKNTERQKIKTGTQSMHGMADSRQLAAGIEYRIWFQHMQLKSRNECINEGRTQKKNKIRSTEPKPISNMNRIYLVVAAVRFIQPQYFNGSVCCVFHFSFSYFADFHFNLVKRHGIWYLFWYIYLFSIFKWLLLLNTHVLSLRHRSRRRSLYFFIMFISFPFLLKTTSRAWLSG